MKRENYPEAYDSIMKEYNHTADEMESICKYDEEVLVAMYESSIGLIRLVAFESQAVILDSGEEVLTKDYPVHEGDSCFEEAVIRSWKKNGLITHDPTPEEYRKLLIQEAMEYNGL